MSLPQGIPALQQENRALKKQLTRSDEDQRATLDQHRLALEKNRLALEKAQQDLRRAHEDLEEAQGISAQSIDANRELAQQLEDSQSSQVSAHEYSQVRKELEELKEQHELVKHNTCLARREFLAHQATSRESHQKSLEKIERLDYMTKLLRNVAQGVPKASLIALFELALSVEDTADQPKDGEAGLPQSTPSPQLEGIPSHKGEDQREATTSDVLPSAPGGPTAEVLTDVAPVEQIPREEQGPHNSTENGHVQEVSPARGDIPRGISGWQGFESQSAKQYEMARERAMQQQRARRQEELRTGIKLEPKMPTFNETWNQVKIGEEAGERRIGKVFKDTIFSGTERPLAIDPATIGAGHPAPSALASDPSKVQPENRPRMPVSSWGRKFNFDLGDTRIDFQGAHQEFQEDSSTAVDPFREFKRGQPSRGHLPSFPHRPKTNRAELELASPVEGGEQQETELHETGFGDHEDKPVAEELSVSQGKKPVPRASSTSDVVPRSTTGTESDTQGRKELDADMSASAKLSEDKVVKSFATALTLKPRIPTSSEVLARRPSEEEATITRTVSEAMKGPYGDMYGRRPEPADSFRVLDKEETARRKAETVARLRARQAQRLAEQSDKNRHQIITAHENAGDPVQEISKADEQVSWSQVANQSIKVDPEPTPTQSTTTVLRRHTPGKAQERATAPIVEQPSEMNSQQPARSALLPEAIKKEAVEPTSLKWDEEMEEEEAAAKEQAKIAEVAKAAELTKVDRGGGHGRGDGRGGGHGRGGDQGRGGGPGRGSG